MPPNQNEMTWLLLAIFKLKERFSVVHSIFKEKLMVEKKSLNHHDIANWKMKHLTMQIKASVFLIYSELVIINCYYYSTFIFSKSIIKKCFFKKMMDRRKAPWKFVNESGINQKYKSVNGFSLLLLDDCEIMWLIFFVIYFLRI